MTDKRQHGDVVHRVGIRTALAEIEAFARGQGAYRFGFGETVQRRTVQLSGVDPVATFRDRPECSGEAEASGDDRRKLLWSGGDEPHLLPGIEVSLGQRQRSRDQFVDHFRVEDLLR